MKRSPLKSKELNYQLSGCIDERPSTRGASNLYSCVACPYIRSHKYSLIATAGGRRMTVYLASTGRSGQFLPKIMYEECTTSEESLYTACWLRDDLTSPEITTLYVAVAGERGIVRLIPVARGVEYIAHVRTRDYKMLVGHGMPVNEVVAHPFYSMIVFSIGDDYSVRMWNGINETTLAIYGGGSLGHKASILSISINASGTRMATTSMDHSVRVWRLEQQENEAIETSLASARDGDSYDVKTTVLFRTLPQCRSMLLHTNYVDCVRFISDDIIASMSCQEEIVIYLFADVSLSEIAENGPEPLTERKPQDKLKKNVHILAKLAVPGSRAWFKRFCVDRNLLAVGNDIGEIFVWDLSDLTECTKDDQCEAEIQPALIAANQVITTQQKVTTANPLIRQVTFCNNRRTLMAVNDSSQVFKFDL